MAEFLARLDIEILVYEHAPSGLACSLDYCVDVTGGVPDSSPLEVLSHIGAWRQCGIRQRPVIAWVREGERQSPPGREQTPKLANEIQHLALVDMGEDWKGEDEIELQAAVRYRQIANAIGIELWAITIVVDKMGPREVWAPLIERSMIEIYAPVVIMVNGAVCAG